MKGVKLEPTLHGKGQRRPTLSEVAIVVNDKQTSNTRHVQGRYLHCRQNALGHAIIIWTVGQGGCSPKGQWNVFSTDRQLHVSAFVLSQFVPGSPFSKSVYSTRNLLKHKEKSTHSVMPKHNKGLDMI